MNNYFQIAPVATTWTKTTLGDAKRKQGGGDLSVTSINLRHVRILKTLAPIQENSYLRKHVPLNCRVR